MAGPRLAAPLVRRLARAPARERFVLRGGLVTAHWVAPHGRLVEDLDLLSEAPFDGSRLAAQLAELVATDVDDGLTLALIDVETIWAETPFPGLRARVTDGREVIQVDIGADDPMIDGPVSTELLPGIVVRTPRPETMIAWKLHGLFERGPGRWRPKDLHDIDLLLRCVELDEARTAASVALAFRSRGDSLEIAARLADGDFGTSRWSAHKWRRHRQTRPPGADPGPLPEVLARVQPRVAPWLR